MRRLMLGGVCGVSMLAGGCASDIGPSPAELKARWDAQNVYLADYKTDLLAFMRTYLNDPTRVRSAAVSQPMLKSVGAGDRYVVCVRYDARNTTGKYMGVKTGYASYVSARLERFYDVPAEVSGTCRDAAYAPFPELEKLTR